MKDGRSKHKCDNTFFVKKHSAAIAEIFERQVTPDRGPALSN